MIQSTISALFYNAHSLSQQQPTRIAIVTLSLLIAAIAVPRSAVIAADVKPIGAAVDISGKVPDVRQAIVSSGYRFQVALRGIDYRGRVERTVLERSEDGRLTIWVALKEVTLTINRITVSGRPGSAVCGPTSIEMGNRRQLWLAFDFGMSNEADQSLVLLKTRFHLPHDNWSVGTPAWATTKGIGMSWSRVTGDVRSGLAKSRDRIEHEFIRIAPQVLEEIVSVPNETSTGTGSIGDAVREKLIADGHLPGWQ